MTSRGGGHLPGWPWGGRTPFDGAVRDTGVRYDACGLIRNNGIWRHQPSPGPAGLDEHQVRRYPAWVRRVTLAMPAHTFLAVVRADEHAHRPTPDDLIPLFCNEICRLFTALVVRPARDAAHQLACSEGGGALSASDNSTIRDPLLRECPIRWPLGGRTALDGAA